MANKFITPEQFINHARLIAEKVATKYSVDPERLLCEVFYDFHVANFHSQIPSENRDQ